jgi:hypothetical protein
MSCVITALTFWRHDALKADRPTSSIAVTRWQSAQLRRTA